MPDIGFIIPGNSVPDNSAIHSQYDIVPDNGMTISSNPDVAISNISGASQRSVRGINPVRRTFNLSFNNREPLESDYIIGFLRQRKGVESFLFTLADVNGSGTDSQGNSVETYEVICESYSVNWISCSYKNIIAVFKEVQNTTANYTPDTGLADEGFTQGDFSDLKDSWDDEEDL